MYLLHGIAIQVADAHPDAGDAQRPAARRRQGETGLPQSGTDGEFSLDIV